jgi:hypothetical protein
MAGLGAASTSPVSEGPLSSTARLSQCVCSANGWWNTLRLAGVRAAAAEQRELEAGADLLMSLAKLVSGLSGGVVGPNLGLIPPSSTGVRDCRAT